MIYCKAAIHRLKPSDIQRIREMPDHQPVIEALAGYLADIVDPGAIDLDDVVAVSMQLKAAGIWDTIKPADFVATYGDRFDAKVTAELKDIFRIEP